MVEQQGEGGAETSQIALLAAYAAEEVRGIVLARDADGVEGLFGEHLRAGLCAQAAAEGVVVPD